MQMKKKLTKECRTIQCESISTKHEADNREKEPMPPTSGNLASKIHGDDARPHGLVLFDCVGSLALALLFGCIGYYN